VINITRFDSGDQGTFGILTLEDFFAWTCELPWRDNQPFVSCIPVGDYEAVPYISRHFGKVYLILHTGIRIGILTHSGNVGGDKSLGFLTHTLGCILLGKYLGRLMRQKAVLFSKPIMNRFLEKAGDRRLKLTIREAF